MALLEYMSHEKAVLTCKVKTGRHWSVCDVMDGFCNVSQYILQCSYFCMPICVEGIDAFWIICVSLKLSQKSYGSSTCVWQFLPTAVIVTFQTSVTDSVSLLYF